VDPAAHPIVGAEDRPGDLAAVPSVDQHQILVDDRSQLGRAVIAKGSGGRFLLHGGVVGIYPDGAAVPGRLRIIWC
jgi:hypothetical protein